MKEKLRKETVEDLKRKGKTEAANEISIQDETGTVWTDRGILDQEKFSNIVDDYPEAEEELKQLRRHLESEQTEQTEVIEQNTESGIDIETLSQVQEPERKRLSGVVGDVFYIVTWIYDPTSDNHMPVALLSTEEVKKIKNRRQEKKKEIKARDQGPSWGEIGKEQKEKWDYQYFTLKGSNIRFKHPIRRSPTPEINKPTNQVLQLVDNPEKVWDKEKVYESTREFIEKYWEHIHEEWYDAVSSYIIHTYLIMPLGMTFYLYLFGKEDTGKTNLQHAKSWLEYNGVSPGAATPKNSVRMAHTYQASLNLEETEKSSKDRRKQIEQLFNTGYRKGATYPIANTDSTSIEKQMDTIYSFNPKTFSANSSDDWVSSFKSRCLFVKTVRAKADVSDPTKIDTENKEQAEFLRNQIAAYCLFNWKDIVDHVEDYRSDLTVSGREADKLSIFCGITEYFVGGDRAQELKNRIKEEEEISGVQDLSDKHRLTLEEVAKQFNKQEADTIVFRYKDIAERVTKRANWPEDHTMGSRTVGKILNDYNLFRDSSQKGKNSEGYTTLELTLDQFEDSMIRYNYKEILDIVLGVSDNTSINSVSSVSSESEEDSDKVKQPTSGLPGAVWKNIPENGVDRKFIEQSLSHEYERHKVSDFIEEFPGIEIVTDRRSDNEILKKDLDKVKW